ncbi:MAG TPA: macro domain-containing protein [Oscillospiraceae bacterium]|nr:macro domain-containing protein [Oscillospiraceae bacterium]HPS34820.1 macro domain-containing protein [Oscillospiraceae bacterium]
MPFTIVRQDITKMKVDAIVNAANPDLAMGGGVCGAIFEAAGSSELQAACDQLAPIRIGDAVITPGFALPSKFIIHTAGPIYRDGKHGEEELLRSCYLNSLKRAAENKCESIAFPLISSGIYGYPKADALRVAAQVIRVFLEEHDIDVSLVVFDKEAYTVSEQLLGEVRSYIDEHYVKEQSSRENEFRRTRQLDAARSLLNEADLSRYNMPVTKQAPLAPHAAQVDAGIDDLVGKLDEPFSETLLHLIDAKGRKDVEVYKRANLDRKLFSKIRTGKGYTPGKRTVIALAIALELSLRETDDLLERAGFALSHSQKFDVIVEYFIVNRHYDIFEINEVLFKYDQPLLGG